MHAFKEVSGERSNKSEYWGVILDNGPGIQKDWFEQHKETDDSLFDLGPDGCGSRTKVDYTGKDVFRYFKNDVWAFWYQAYWTGESTLYIVREEEGQNTSLVHLTRTVRKILLFKAAASPSSGLCVSGRPHLSIQGQKRTIVSFYCWKERSISPWHA